MPLTKKLSLAMSAVLLMTFLCLWGAVAFYLKPESHAQAIEQTQQLLDARSKELGGWLMQRVSEIRILKEADCIRELNFDELKPYVTRLNVLLRDQFGNPTETLAVGGADGKGWISDDITIDVSMRPYFRAAMTTQKEYVISEPVISKSDHNPIFLLCFPIRNAHGEPIGFINGSVNLNLFAEIARSISLYDAHAWIMDRQGAAYTPVPQGISDESLEALCELQDGRGYSQRIGAPGTTVFYTDVPYADNWLLCMAIEDSAIYAKANRFATLLLPLGALLCLLSTLLAGVVAASVLKPLGILAGRMDQVSNGDLSVRFASSGTDEISVLGETFNQMVARIEQLLAQVNSEQAQKRKAELWALQSQLNPHFLYNTLDTIQWKALAHSAYDVADMIQLLSQFYRLALSDTRREFTSCRDEATHAMLYLSIQKIRYSTKLNYHVETDPSAECCFMPHLLIQPLVENALYHGIKPTGRQGSIHVRIARRKEELHILVTDNGAGMSPDTLACVTERLRHAEWQEHYGMFSVHERLRLLYGAQAHMDIHSEEGKGTQISLRFPAKMGDSICTAS